MGRGLYVAMLALVGVASLGLLALNFRDYPAGNGRDEIAHLQVIAFYHEAHRSPVLPDDLAGAHGLPALDEALRSLHAPPESLDGLLDIGLIGQVNPPALTVSGAYVGTITVTVSY